MKYKYTLEVESESLEKDIDQVVNTAMSAIERYLRLKKETEPEKVEVPESKINEIEADIHGMDNRIDGLEARLDSFCEVDIKKRVKLQEEKVK